MEGLYPDGRGATAGGSVTEHAYPSHSSSSGVMTMTAPPETIASSTRSPYIINNQAPLRERVGWTPPTRTATTGGTYRHFGESQPKGAFRSSGDVVVCKKPKRKKKQQPEKPTSKKINFWEISSVGSSTG